MKTANEVFADFCTCIDKARDEMGVSSSWNVLARSPQNMVSVDKVILVDKIGERQKGFQNVRFATGQDGRLHEYWEWIEEYQFQVNCIRERNINDTKVTVTADEVAALLKAWVNSQDGADFMRTKGIAPLFVRDIIPQQYTSDNEVYQRYVHFDVSVQVVQVCDRTPPAVDSVEIAVVHMPHCNASECGDPVYEKYPLGS